MTSTEIYALHLVQDEDDPARWAVTLDGEARGWVREHPDRGKAPLWSYQRASDAPESEPSYADKQSAAWALLASCAH